MERHFAGFLFDLGRSVSKGCSSKERSDAEGSQKRRQRDCRVRNRQKKKADVPVFEVMKRDSQERVQEPTAEQVTPAAEGGGSTGIRVSRQDPAAGLRAVRWPFRGCGGVCPQGGFSGSVS